VSKFERFLVPGSTEQPDCRCGAEMRLVKANLSPQSANAEIRLYECPTCGHEIRLTVWVEPVTANGEISGI
jgi:DNA-directed RNA polymerase subunit RPC12/RpoP